MTKFDNISDQGGYWQSYQNWMANLDTGPHARI